MMDTRKSFSGCGGQNGKKANGLGEDEGIDRNRLRGMGMMGRWMEVGT